MAVRKFDGSDDTILTAIGGLVGKSTAGAELWIVNRDDPTDPDDDTDDPICQIVSAAGTGGTLVSASFIQSPRHAIVTADNIILANSAGSFVSSTGAPSAITVLAANDWVGIGYRKASGTATPEFFKYVFSTSTMTTSQGSGTLADGTAATSAYVCTIGKDEFFNRFGGLIAVGAIWQTAPTLADITDALDARATQAVYDIAPDALWDFNQEFAVDPVLDLTGNGADQIAILGTDIQTGDDPPSWTFGLTLADNLVKVGGVWIPNLRKVRVSGAWF